MRVISITGIRRNFPNEASAVTAWYLTIELGHRPDHMPCEKNTGVRLYGPASSWQ